MYHCSVVNVSVYDFKANIYNNHENNIKLLVVVVYSEQFPYLLTMCSMFSTHHCLNSLQLEISKFLLGRKDTVSWRSQAPDLP